MRGLVYIRAFHTYATAAVQGPANVPAHLPIIKWFVIADASALREAYNDAIYFKDEALRAFKLGVLSLEERAQVGSLSLDWKDLLLVARLDGALGGVVKGLM